MNGKQIRRYFAILMILIHLVVSVVMVVAGHDIAGAGNQVTFMMIQAISFAQCSLLATWIVLGSESKWIRIPMIFLLLTWSIFWLCCVMDNKINLERMTPFLIMLLFQFSCVTVSIFLIQLLFKWWKMGAPLDTSTRYSMGTLMIVVTLTAVAIGIGKYIVQDVLLLSWESFLNLGPGLWSYPISGGFNVLVVVLMLPALWCFRWQWKFILLLPSFLLVAAISVVERFLFENIYNINISIYLHLAHNLCQAFIFYATVFPFWRWETKLKAEIPVNRSEDIVLEGIQD